MKGLRVHMPHLVLSGPGAETGQFPLLFEAGSYHTPQGARRGAFPVLGPAVHGLTVPLGGQGH